MCLLQENKERVENIGISALGIFELGREKNEGFKVDDTILLVGRGKETIKQWFKILSGFLKRKFSILPSRNRIWAILGRN